MARKISNLNKTINIGDIYSGNDAVGEGHFYIVSEVTKSTVAFIEIDTLAIYVDGNKKVNSNSSENLFQLTMPNPEEIPVSSKFRRYGYIDEATGRPFFASNAANIGKLTEWDGDPTYHCTMW